MKRRSKLLLSCLLLLSAVSFGQQAKLDALDVFSGSLVKKLREAEGEKAYLVTDRTLYAAGQTLWFRSFLLRSVSEKISTKSANLFVDLVDEKDSVVRRALLNARNQQTGGKLFLPENLTTGNYWVRAYTKTMANGDKNAAAVVPVYVINPANPNAPRTNEKSPASGESSLAIEIFPEGGSLITGINTVVGFYVHDNVGNPVALNGQIKDSRDSVVATFATNNFGMARAAFFPFFNRKYKAVTVYKDKTIETSLPAFNRFAAQLSVLEHNDNTLRLQTVLEDSIYKKDFATYLIALSRDSLCFASIGYGSYETAVPLSNFPKGIATFLLFDDKFKLLSQRRVYIKQDQLNTVVNLDKGTYAKRSRANLSASVLNRSNQPVVASLTVAVSDSSALLDQNAADATSLLRKWRETGIGNWDLLHLADLSDQDIDLLLLNSRPFYNETLTQTKTVDDVADDSIFYIKGKLFSTKGGALSNRVLNLVSKAGIFSQDTTDAAGRFSFPLAAYMDSTQFSLQIDAAKGKSEAVTITLDKFPFPRFETPAYLKTKIAIPAARRSAYLRRYADTAFAGDSRELLQQVNVNAKNKNAYGTPGRPVLSSSVLTSEQLMKLGTGNIGLGLLRMPGVQLLNGLVQIYGPSQIPGMGGSGASPEPIALLDGSPVALSGGGGNSPLINYLNSLNPREIDYIEVFKGPEASIFGLRGGNGVVYIHSAGQVHQDFTPSEGNAYKFYREGYANPAEFPATAYDEKSNKDMSIADARSTLYWNENELVDAKGKSVFTFFTSDIPGHYKVVITGITRKGELIYKTLSFTNK